MSDAHHTDPADLTDREFVEAMIRMSWAYHQCSLIRGEDTLVLHDALEDALMLHHMRLLRLAERAVGLDGESCRGLAGANVPETVPREVYPSGPAPF